MGRKPLRNKLGQFASRSIMEDAVESSKVRKQTIIIDSDSEDLDLPPEEQNRHLQISGKMQDCKKCDVGKSPATADTSQKFRAEFYNDSDETMEDNSDSEDYEYSSEDIETMLNELDKVFGKAEKKMCDQADGDQAKNKKVISKTMEWLYHKVVDVKLTPKSKTAKKKPKKN